VVLAFTLDQGAAHRLADPLALAMLAAGIAVGGGFGVVRALTMVVRREGAVPVTRGTGRTVTMWLVTIGVRIGMAALSFAVGVPEGTTEGLLFAAATIGAQNLVLARRGGLLGSAAAPALAEERVG
jgi:hypothetical protein